MIQFPDVSFYQGKIDFTKMQHGVIIRAGQNLWRDPMFNTNWPAAKAAGLLRGSYWFYDSRIEPAKQARAYLDVIGYDRGEMELWVDLEEKYRGPYEGWRHWYTFIETLRSLAPEKQIGIYTGPSYWNEHMLLASTASRDWFKQFPLWIAHYGVTYPTIPKPWTSFVLWQYGTPAIGQQMGVESIEIDMNNFNGDADAFYLRYNKPIVPEQPSGGTTVKGKMLNFVVNVRNSAGAIAAALRVGDVVYGPVSGARPRISFDKIYRADGSVHNLGTVCNAVTSDGGNVQYMTLTNESEPTAPPVVPPVAANVRHTILVRDDGMISLDGQAYE